MIDILLVDDSRAVRDGLRRFLDGEDGLRVVGTCADGSDVVDAVQRWAPRVVVLDLAMPVVDGFAAAAALRVSSPATALVALSGQALGSAVSRARDIGFAGYLEKSQPPEEVAEAIRRVAAGECGWSERARRALAAADRR